MNILCIVCIHAYIDAYTQTCIHTYTYIRRHLGPRRCVALVFGVPVLPIMFEDSLPSGVDGEPAAPSGDGATAPARTPAEILGLVDNELDDLKESAQEVFKKAGVAKRPKLTHGTFFDDDKGLKKILRTFPKIRFHGKGHEFDDLKTLLRNYDRWFKELHPFNDNFEDLVYKASSVLQEKETTEDGLRSDPRERLHMLRFEYKNAPPETPAAPTAATPKKELPEDVKKRIEENRQRALRLREEKLAAGKAAEAGAASSSPAGAKDLDMDTRFEMFRAL